MKVKKPKKQKPTMLDISQAKAKAQAVKNTMVLAEYVLQCEHPRDR